MRVNQNAADIYAAMSFVRQYPEKAAAYAKTNKSLEVALARKGEQDYETEILSKYPDEKSLSVRYKELYKEEMERQLQLGKAIESIRIIPPARTKEFNFIEDRLTELRRAFGSDLFSSLADQAYEELRLKYQEKLPEKKEINVVKEVVRSAEKKETDEFVRDHILEKDLSYQDAQLPDEAKAKMLEYNKTFESLVSMQKFCEQFSKKSNLEAIRKQAKTLQEKMLTEAKRVGIPVSPYGMSKSWAMWDIGKQYYLFTHPDESGEEYEIDDPTTSLKKQEEIVNRQLGWEAYRAFKNPDWQKRVSSDPHFSKALVLLNKVPKSNGQLRSKDLAELGALLRGV